MNTLLHGIVSVGMFLGSLLGVYHPAVEAPAVTPSLGDAVQPIAGSTYSLSGSGVSSSATSIILSSLTLPQTGQKLQDSDLSDTFYATLEPGNRSRQELVSCTTVTQNANGTATLSGCARGLAPITPYTASSSLQFAHSGGSQVIFSDSPQLYRQFAAKANNETITGQWTFSTFPITPSNSAASETVAGVAELATGAEAAASTQSGSAGRLALPTSIATSTWNTNTSGNVVPVTGVSGRLAQGFLANTTGIASSSSLQTDAAGNSYWIPGYRLLNTDSFTTATMGLTASTSLFTATVPANTFGTNGMIHGKLFGMTSGGSGLAHFDLAYGGASTTYRINPGLASGPQPFQLDFYIKENNLTNSQKTYFTTASTSPFSTGTFPNGFAGATSTTAVDTTQSQRLQMIIFTSQPTLGYSFDFMTLEVLR